MDLHVQRGQHDEDGDNTGAGDGGDRQGAHGGQQAGGKGRVSVTNNITPLNIQYGNQKGE